MNRIIYFSLLILGLYSQPSFAQVPDTLQTAPPTQPATSTGDEEDEDPSYAVAEADQDSSNHFYQKFNADGTASTGNVQRLLLQFSSALDWKPNSKFKLSSSPSFVYGKQGGQLTEREFNADLRASLWHQKIVYGLGFVAWERSNLRHINNRWSQGAGVGVKIIQKKRAYLSITNLILHENTDFIERTDIDVWRNSTRFFGEFSPGSSGRFTINSVLFLQPAISMPNNFRWSSTLVLAYRLNKNISLRTKFEDAYESYVVPGRQSNDFRWTFGLSIEN